MRFLIIASQAESLFNFRGALISALQEKGLEVHVAAPGFCNNVAARCLLEQRGVVVHNVQMSRTGTNPLVDLATLLNLWYLMRSVRPSACLAYTVKPVIYGTLAAVLAKVPRRFSLITGLGYAFTGESKGMRGAIKAVVQRLYAFALLRVDRIFFQNPDDRALFRGLDLVAKDMPTVVVNGSGVDVEHFALTALPPGAPCFLLTARLLGDKGVREYVEAAHRIKQRHPEVKFHLVGWVDENPDAVSQMELESWVARGDIEYFGRLNDVRPAIAGCSVFVLPSYREGTPRTVLEAMAMGRAIITTDAPGCRETVVHGENGFLVPVKSVDALANAMLLFVEEQMLASRMGQRSRQIAEQKYDVHKVNAVMLREMGLA